MSFESRRLAVMDLGTHTLLLLIADVSGEHFSIVRQEQRIVRLGRGIENSGLICEEALQETIAALLEYKNILNELKVEEARLTATAVLRDPANASKIKAALEANTGFSVNIIPGQEEARLVFRAGVYAFPQKTHTLVIDIGGGSVEFVEGYGNKAERLVSLPLGVVKLTERFIKAFPASGEALCSLQALLAESLTTSLKDYCRSDIELIGVAGTFTTASAMIQGLSTYDPARITGSLIHEKDAEIWLNRVAAMSLEEQKRIPGLHPKRAGFIVAGFALIDSFFNFFQADTITVSDQGLRFGVLLDWMDSLKSA